MSKLFKPLGVVGQEPFSKIDNTHDQFLHSLPSVENDPSLGHSLDYSFQGILVYRDQAASRLIQIEEESAAILKAYPDLRRSGGSSEPAAFGTGKPKRRFSAAARR